MTRVEFEGGYVTVQSPPPGEKAFRLKVWKRRGDVDGGRTHTLHDQRVRYSEAAALATAKELAEFWKGE